MATATACPERKAVAPPTDGKAQPAVNVGDTERWASAVGGGLLALLGLRRGSLGGLALAAVGGSLLYRGLSGHCAGYQALDVSTAPPRGERTSVRAGTGIKIEKSITINKPPEEIYRFWRELENLPQVMSHLKEVRCTDGKHSHWVARAPLNASVEWEAEIHNEKENELIAWRSLPGSTIDTAGATHFIRAPGGRGTEIRVTLKYDPPAGRLGDVVAKLFGEQPRQQISADLRRFKQLTEAGETPTIEGQSRGQC